MKILLFDEAQGIFRGSIKAAETRTEAWLGGRNPFKVEGRSSYKLAV